jgi:uncharacterized membrane protein
MIWFLHGQLCYKLLILIVTSEFTMNVKPILALAVIISSIGLVSATVSQSAHAASCQEFLNSNGEATKQNCSSDSSDTHANALHNGAHFQHRNH